MTDRHFKCTVRVPQNPPRSGSKRTLAWISLSLNPLAAAIAMADQPLCPVPSEPWQCELQDGAWKCAGQWQQIAEIADGTSSQDIEVRADRVLSEDGDNFTLEGNVDVSRGAQRLTGPSVKVQNSNQTAQTTEPTRLENQTLIAYAQSIEADFGENRSELKKVRYALKDGRGNGEAGSIVHQDQQSRLSAVSFTSCPDEQPAWKIRASRVEIDHQAEVGRARDFKLYVGGVPVFYFPYASFPLNENRKTGVLSPTIGFNSDGLDFSLPYYFNLAPNYDTTITARHITERGVILGNEFRYLGAASTGLVRAAYMPKDRLRDLDDRYSWNIDWNASLNQNFNFATSLNRVSDDFYFEDLGDSLTTNSTSVVASQLGVYGRGVWGSFQNAWGSWQTGVMADRYEIVDPANPSAEDPIRRAPRVYFDVEQNLGGFSTGIRSELVSFKGSDALEGSRFDAEPFLRYQWRNAFSFIKPEISYRYTQYDLDDDRSLQRSLPIASLDMGLYFDRAQAWFAPKMRQTLEPRLYYLRAPFRDQSEFPTFDTTELDFSLPQLFRPNRFSGPDRQADANQVALAVTTRWIDDTDGEERARLSLGQIRYFEDSLVTLPNVAPFTSSAGVWVAEGAARLNQNWRLQASHQYDPELSRTRLSAVRLQRILGDRGILNFGYRYRFNTTLPLEQIDVSGMAPINARWSVIGRLNYSLTESAFPQSQVLEALSGFEYQSCCWKLRVLGRRYLRAGTLEGRNTLFFELELNGLGVLGRKTDRLLQNAIVGYSDLAMDLR